MKKVVLPLALLALAAAIYEPAPYPVGFQKQFVMESTGELVTGTWNGATFVNGAGARLYGCGNIYFEGPGHSCFVNPPEQFCVSDYAHTWITFACDHSPDDWWQFFAEPDGDVKVPTFRREDIPDWVPFMERSGG